MILAGSGPRSFSTNWPILWRTARRVRWRRGSRPTSGHGAVLILRGPDYRILIALREDYLAHLEGLKSAMPSVTQNRIGSRACRARKRSPPSRGPVQVL